MAALASAGLAWAGAQSEQRLVRPEGGWHPQLGLALTALVQVLSSGDSGCAGTQGQVPGSTEAGEKC